jgi:hypothetical protein
MACLISSFFLSVRAVIAVLAELAGKRSRRVSDEHSETGLQYFLIIVTTSTSKELRFLYDLYKSLFTLILTAGAGWPKVPLLEKLK